MLKNYILDGKIPIIETDILKWGKWFESSDRIVKKTKFNDISISTVFLGIDHQYFAGPPLLFETMVFGGELNMECTRYSTWEQAEKGHDEMVDRVKETL